MITIQPLARVDSADLERIVTPYISEGAYVVRYRDSPTATSFELHYVLLPEPSTRKYEHFDAATLQRYSQILHAGFSFGAYEGELLMGLIIAEAQEWNRTLSVWEFHVAPTYRRRGIGRQLMAQTEEQARRSGLRAIVCETQNANAAAIMVYRKLGFAIEGIDISLYSNRDYPDGDIAVFMKRRLLE
ncbi:MAG: GNAT family N-acetyltransferase [Caldilineaceae bacterium]